MELFRKHRISQEMAAGILEIARDYLFSLMTKYQGLSDELLFG